MVIPFLLPCLKKPDRKVFLCHQPKALRFCTGDSESKSAHTARSSSRPSRAAAAAGGFGAAGAGGGFRFGVGWAGLQGETPKGVVSSLYRYLECLGFMGTGAVLFSKFLQETPQQNVQRTRSVLKHLRCRFPGLTMLLKYRGVTLEVGPSMASGCWPGGFASVGLIGVPPNMKGCPLEWDHTNDHSTKPGFP